MIKFVPQPGIAYVNELVKRIEELNTQDEHGTRVWVTLIEGGAMFQHSHNSSSVLVTAYGAASVQAVFAAQVGRPHGEPEWRDICREWRTSDLTETATAIIGFFTNEWTISN